MKSMLAPLWVVTIWNGPQRLGSGSPRMSDRKVADLALSRADTMVWLKSIAIVIDRACVYRLVDGPRHRWFRRARVRRCAASATILALARASRNRRRRPFGAWAAALCARRQTFDTKPFDRTCA